VRVAAEAEASPRQAEVIGSSIASGRARHIAANRDSAGAVCRCRLPLAEAHLVAELRQNIDYTTQIWNNCTEETR
jgi:hypothetical protein